LQTYAASLSAAISRSQPASWFQLALFWSTNLLVVLQRLHGLASFRLQKVSTRVDVVSGFSRTMIITDEWRGLSTIVSPSMKCAARET
jgi:hypothetical protein